MNSAEAFPHIIDALKRVDAVEAIALGGSRAAGIHDPASDYDVYVYTTGPVPDALRDELLAPFCPYREIGNQFWETEDDCRFADGIEIELIYRSLDWLAGELDALLNHCRASVGYSTCLWANLLGSRILFDRAGRAEALRQQYSLPYPEPLKRSIIDKNLPLVGTAIPSYRHQIAKALKRGDVVSVQHRTAALLASYFDIIFAVNGLPHPGEKRMPDFLSRCAITPEHAVRDIEAVLALSGSGNPELNAAVDRLTNSLYELLRAEGVPVTEVV